MKNIALCIVLAIIALATNLNAQEINLEGSSLEVIVNSVYRNYEQQNALDRVPEGYKIIYKFMQEGSYIFDDQELSKLIPEWEFLYYYYTG